MTDYSSISIPEHATIEENLTAAEVLEAARDPVGVRRWDSVTQSAFMLGQTKDGKMVRVLLRRRDDLTWLVVWARLAIEEERAIYQKHTQQKTD
jgi:hypothetical protein